MANRTRHRGRSVATSTQEIIVLRLALTLPRDFEPGPVIESRRASAQGRHDKYRGAAATGGLRQLTGTLSGNWHFSTAMLILRAISPLRSGGQLNSFDRRLLAHSHMNNLTTPRAAVQSQSIRRDSGEAARGNNHRLHFRPLTESARGIFAGLFAVSLMASPALAGSTFSESSGAGFEMPIAHNGLSADDTATSSVSQSNEYGQFYSAGRADLPSRSLRAEAFAEGFADHPEDGRGFGAASHVALEDYLRLDDRGLFDLGLLGGLHFYFFPEVDGLIVGRGQATFVVEIGGEAKQVSFNSDGFHRDTLSFVLPGSVFGPILGVLPEIHFDMHLYVDASATTDERSLVDFFHTATLPTILVGDANGNYVPGSEGIRLIGSSGISYPVAPVPVPEPSTVLLLLSSIIAVDSLRRLGR